jgi:hypothetical protein
MRAGALDVTFDRLQVSTGILYVCKRYHTSLRSSSSWKAKLLRAKSAEPRMVRRALVNDLQELESVRELFTPHTDSPTSLHSKARGREIDCRTRRRLTLLAFLPFPRLLLPNTPPSMSSSLSSRCLLPNLLPNSHAPRSRPNLYLLARRSDALHSSSLRSGVACLSQSPLPATPSNSMTFIRTFTAGSSRAASPHDEEGSKRANARKAAEIARDFRT